MFRESYHTVMPTKAKSGYSFCIITDNKEPQKLQREIESIHALHIPEYEIIIESDNTPPYGKIAALRNRACRRAAFNHIVLVDDDIIFHNDFYDGLIQYGENYDVCSCKILNPDGSRFYDWKIHVDGKNYLLDYEQSDPNVVLTGGFCVMKRHVFDSVQWNDALGYYQLEDVDFSNRLKKAGFRISLNPFCTVTHDAPYKQIGRRVVRWDLRGRFLYCGYWILLNIFKFKEGW